MRSILFSLATIFIFCIISTTAAAINATNLDLWHRSGTWSVQLTWYDGSSLDNPACGGKTPSPHAAVVAVAHNSPWFCGDVLLLSAKQNGRTITKKVTVVDACGECAKKPTGHIDATPGVWQTFQKNLNIGVLQGISVKRLKKGSSTKPQ